MNVELDDVGIMPVSDEDAANYASPQEVEAAIQALKDEDYVKLMVIAGCHCKSRNFTPSVLEREELLAEAFAATLRPRGKRWNKRVTFIKHLDRAMENISGHMAGDRANIVHFPDGLSPSREQAGEEPLTAGPDEQLMTKQEITLLLESIFGLDKEATHIFRLRAEGFQASDIQKTLKLSTTEYETVAKRIRRKHSAFLIKSTKTNTI